jgi:hypothetical protein
MPELFIRPARYATVAPAAGETERVVIDRQYLQCVAFICGHGLRRREPLGTATFIAVPEDDLSIVYAVTARHVITKNAHRDLCLRVSLKGGGYRDIPTQGERWSLHDSTDIAAIRIDIPDEEYEARWIPPSFFATLQQIRILDISGWRVGEGDEVFYPGLFTKFHGRHQMLPVVRFGHISLMPYEPIPIEWHDPARNKNSLRDIEAYLIEAKSWHGFSGSPVFLYYPLEELVRRALNKAERDRGMRDDNTLQRFTDMRQGLRQANMIGIVSAYWDYEADLRRKYSVHAGLAVVIPTDAVIELLNGEVLMSERKKIAAEERDRRPTPRPASAEKIPPTISKADFQDALKRASRRLSPPDRGKKRT